MNAYVIHTRMVLRLAARDRGVLFFAYIFPLIFFFMFGQMMHAEQGGAWQMVSMVLIIGVLGNGLFGAGIRAVTDREQNILRRFKVAPISSGVIMVSSMVTGLVMYLPLVALVLILANRVYHMPMPPQMLSLVLFISLGLVAFRAMGGLVAAVVNSMQEMQILIQLLYLPMLMLSGATIPISIMPAWLQNVAQFVPTTYFASGLQPILHGAESIADNLPAAGVLLLTTVVATFLSMKLFRWEKEEKLKPSAKLWLVAVLAPFFVMGLWQLHAKDNVVKAKVLGRELRRSRTFLVHDARLVVGDGRVIERGSVLVKDGKIAEIYEGNAPDPKSLSAEAVEAAGKTLLPGLIDAHVHLGATGGFSEDPNAYLKIDRNIDRELAAYLYCGVTAVKSVGDALDTVLKHRALSASGEKLGTEVFAVGPMFTAEGGHGTEMLRYLPESIRPTIEQQLVRLPKTAEEARAQVAELKARGVDGIKVILEAGGGSVHFNRLDLAILHAIVNAARAADLPVVVHTGSARDVADAIDAGVNGVEHGSMMEAIPEPLFARMKTAGITYDPTLTVVEALADLIVGKADPLDRSLVQQAAPPDLLQETRKLLKGPQMEATRAAYSQYPLRPDVAKQNLTAAYRAGVKLVAGTDSGNPLLLHGPAIHRELQLWVAAGVPPAVALQTATRNAAELLGAGNRIGLIRKGFEASLLLVDGNPLEDISSTERISAVFFKGERLARADLFDQE
jgi:imidazolonepropionase-like amidohydrolase/ABC-type multidrug transport system permease subunit